jgi:hypothetical protein
MFLNALLVAEVLPLRVEASVLQPTSIPAYQRHITYIVL